MCLTRCGSVWRAGRWASKGFAPSFFFFFFFPILVFYPSLAPCFPPPRPWSLQTVFVAVAIVAVLVVGAFAQDEEDEGTRARRSLKIDLKNDEMKIESKVCRRVFLCENPGAFLPPPYFLSRFDCSTLTSPSLCCDSADLTFSFFFFSNLSAPGSQRGKRQVRVQVGDQDQGQRSL